MENPLEIVGVDLDQTFLTCDSKLYRFLNTLNLNNGKNKASKNFVIEDCNYKIGNLNKIFKLFNPQSYVAMPDAINTINELHNNGKKIHFLSNRPKLKPIVKMTSQWFKLNNVQFDKIVLGCKDKLHYAKTHNFNYFIDNDINICRQFTSNSDIKTFHFSQDCKENNNEFILVSSWNEIKSSFNRQDNIKNFEDEKEF